MKFYTYLWLREHDGTFPAGAPYYVGKGSGKRAYESKPRHRPPKDRSSILIQHWRDEDTALAYERYIIDFFGRIDNGTGCLRNRTDGGDKPTPTPESRSRCGRLAVERGDFLRSCTTEVRAKGGRTQGRRNAENGHMAKIGHIQGLKNTEIGRKRGLIQGPKNVASGQAQKWGRTAGRLAVESGQLAKIQIRENSDKGRHNRWHVWRGIVKPECPLCQKSVSG